MQAGTIFGYQGLVAALLERLRRELAELAGCEPAEVRAILTGGLAAAPWAAGLAGITATDPTLTLTGLAILHAEVSGGERLPLGLGDPA
jgi:pantothenate kinase type III